MLFGHLALVALLAYLIGALPIGALVAGVHRINISEHGSRRTGSTNVLRTVGKRAAGLVLLGDFLKGTAAVLAARWLTDALLGPGARMSLLGFGISLATAASILAAAAAVAGHVWSIYLRLRWGMWGGGRGVATGLGASLVVNPWITIAALAAGIPTIIVSRYVSLGSILGAVAAAVTIVIVVLLGQMEALALLMLWLPLFVIAAHRDNIERLLKGTERKIDERAKV